jgi:beta-N-acetylhexosaminidase
MQFSLLSLPWILLTFVSDLTLEEKVGQILMAHFYGEEANDEAKVLVQEVKVGGIIYYNWANSLHSPQQVQALSRGLQELVKGNTHAIPLFIAADQEGGRVARLREGFTDFPGNGTIGITGNFALAEEVAYAMGRELLAVGVNMNLSPVVDVNSNPKNPVIGDRSFGADPLVVTAFGEKALRGFQRANVIPVLKHFPGYGDVTVDPHEDLPKNPKSFSDLERVELFPFAKLSPIADAVMTAHLLVPAIDPEHCSTLSEITLKYLRETLGFQGVIISDSLVMEGVLKNGRTVEEAAICALIAGCDHLILGGKLLSGEKAGLELKTSDVKRVHAAIVDAVLQGRIPEEKIDRAVDRLLKLKRKYLKGNREVAKQIVHERRK